MAGTVRGLDDRLAQLERRVDELSRRTGNPERTVCTVTYSETVELAGGEYVASTLWQAYEDPAGLFHASTSTTAPCSIEIPATGRYALHLHIAIVGTGVYGRIAVNDTNPALNYAILATSSASGFTTTTVDVHRESNRVTGDQIYWSVGLGARGTLNGNVYATHTFITVRRIW